MCLWSSTSASAITGMKRIERLVRPQFGRANRIRHTGRATASLIGSRGTYFAGEGLPEVKRRHNQRHANASGNISKRNGNPNAINSTTSAAPSANESKDSEAERPMADQREVVTLVEKLIVTRFVSILCCRFVEAPFNSANCVSTDPISRARASMSATARSFRCSNSESLVRCTFNCPASRAVSATAFARSSARVVLDATAPPSLAKATNGSTPSGTTRTISKPLG